MKTLLHFFLLLITLWVSIIIPAVHSQCIKDQQLSLLQFKSSLVFLNSAKLISWNASTDCCSWVGVTCSRNGRVLGLDISSQGIAAGIDNSSCLFHLHYLQSLNLADNRLGSNSQSIPSAIGNLLNLRYLNLSLNDYSGKIPIEISRLTRLVVVDFSYNTATLKLGSPNLHTFVQTELRELYLDRVQISEQGRKWCRAISDSLPNLRVLSMSSCDLSGPFLQSLAKLRSLSVIRLDRTNISAPVPGFFANFSNLTVLSLPGCNLHGTFPKEIFQLPSLQSIDLSDNDQLDGSLPEFPRNGSLQHLHLSWTKFSGLLPNSIGNLKMLSTIYIQGCNFTGPMPKSMTNLTQLVSMWMSGNKLEGSIPSFSGAKNVVGIDLSHNGLTGTINSTHWRNLAKLSSLDLKSNKLDGNIPSSLFSLPLLDDLDLSSNQFSGPFPEISNVSSYWRNLTKLSYISLGSNKLDGNIPASLFSLPLLYRLDLSSNQFSGPFPEISNVSSFLLNGPDLELDLSSNNLEGPLPMSIFSLRRLTALDVSSNNLSGSFPLDGLHQLRNISVLDLSHNNLFLSHDFTNFSYSSFSRLFELRLVSMKLRTFPNFLRNQSNLRSLDLSDNQINGKIPNWIWSLSDLTYLNLSCNSLDSLEVPSNNLSYLEYLDLHSNQFHGQIPIFPSLYRVYYLDFSRNYFSSPIPSTIGDMLVNTGFLSLSSNNLNAIIPESLCNSQFLQILDLSNNSLSGTVPRCLTTMSTLEVLNLRRNNLTNVNEFSHNCSLATVDISGNQIQGQFLKSLVHCTQLEVLNLGNNLIAEPFPCFLRNTSTLRVLVLRSNKFYGRIRCRKTNGTWPVLQIIDLAHNNLSGEVPGTALTTWQAMRTSKDNAPRNIHSIELGSIELGGGTYYQEDTIPVTNKGLEFELVNVLTIFISIDFSCNKFNGSIPEEIGELKSLYALNLSNNAFTGAVPSSLSNLSELESLDLSKNKLSGQIPLELTKLTFLEFLNLSYNQLVGRIPSGAQFSTFDAASFQGNKGLWGPPLTVDNGTGFSSPKLEGNHSNPGHEINWDIICPEIGFTCGFGIVIGSLLFCKRWRKWYYRAMYNMLLKIFPQLEQRFGHHRRHVYAHQRYWKR
ncbi:putative leucine-rich repeat-containing, plant-type, leucine-rich repeat domain, L [Rosa chinensis]|uniref:Putative leucine-rich repeat-containing, plant-type, leucine-rich repeat domain, L n=1 Tax=Rosa chinensis TaxID=74649 RepID=A0A2P6SGR9_ROSCH|nr:receptor-like protein 7 [Rosa chinensis]PRQ57894.1 putative leucine-rich repeat-containing, plant-type, leucine-rich repeat domain, L [Rosa chinensis]